MIDAYILIQTEIGMMAQVAASLRQIPGVSNAVVVTGPYDVIARVTAVDMDSTEGSSSPRSKRLTVSCAP